VKPAALPDYDLLHQMFLYGPDTGLLSWSIRPGPAAAPGDRVGNLSRDGYLRVKLQGQEMRVHRVIWKMVYGRDPEFIIDHIDGNRTNNRLENLRQATYSQNIANSRIPYDNTSGLKGAHFLRGKWVSSITVRGDKKYLGIFKTPQEAHAAYCTAAREHFGEFARTN
jgi:hypothetical protein